jgi:hypothetical protein
MKRQPVVASSAASSRSPSNRRKKSAEALAVGRANPAPPQLTRRAIERIPGDLLPMLIKAHYDRHRRPPQTPPD